ncbi:hypothetical protein HID58_032755 [Brassica napus]|uniref:Pentatricopeptide repeat-containing protein n=1 Tax=Brassica napus TaxID=3708 RepID=A0ABQ8BXH8_BRANA|nr:hypothetical protein HID58_032755 [Brassica napus]
MKGLCDNQRLEMALEIFEAFQKSEMDLNTATSNNIIVNGMFKGSKVEEAWQLFTSLPLLPDVRTYSILISGLIREGKFLGAEELYEEMLHRGIMPNAVTYTAMSRLDEAKEMFDFMVSKGCSPDLVTLHINEISRKLLVLFHPALMHVKAGVISKHFTEFTSDDDMGHSVTLHTLQSPKNHHKLSLIPRLDITERSSAMAKHNTSLVTNHPATTRKIFGFIPIKSNIAHRPIFWWRLPLLLSLLMQGGLVTRVKARVRKCGGSKVIRNPHVVSVCPKARNPHMVSDCQPSNPPGPEPAGTNTHYPRTQHQRRDNFKLGEGVKHSVATGGIRTRVRIGVLTTSRPLAHHPVHQ